MGNERLLNPNGGFSEYLFYQVGDVISANGHSGKVISRIGDKGRHFGLPSYSNTSSIYFKLGDNGNTVEQMRIYAGRRVAYDFDWGHNHKEFPEGVVHVHVWTQTASGTFTRHEPRFMNDKEMAQYGDLLRKANPKVKFRP